MKRMKLLSRSQLANLAGVADDIIAFWVRDGLIPSVVTGERKHRRFDGWGIKLAILLRELRSYGANVGTMREVVEQLNRAVDLFEAIPQHHLIFDALSARSNMANAEKNGEDPSRHRAFAKQRSGPAPGPIESEALLARYGDDPAWSYFLQHGRWEETDIVAAEAAAELVPLDRMAEFYLGSALMRGEDVLVVFRNRDGEISLQLGLADGQLPAASVMAFDLEKLFAIEWFEFGSVE